MTQPEARLQRRIQHYLKSQGIFCFKVHGSEFMVAGLPDIVACMDGYFLGIEVKMPGNSPSERQLYVHSLIADSGGVVIVATSVDEVRTFVESQRSRNDRLAYRRGTQRRL